MADRGLTSGKLPTSTMSKQKRMKQRSDTKQGSPELVLEIKLTLDGDFRGVALCCFYSQAGDLFGTRRSDTYVFNNSYWRYSLFIQHFFTRKLILRLFKGYYMSFRP